MVGQFDKSLPQSEIEIEERIISIQFAICSEAHTVTLLLMSRSDELAIKLPESWRAVTGSEFLITFRRIAGLPRLSKIPDGSLLFKYA